MKVFYKSLFFSVFIFSTLLGFSQVLPDSFRYEWNLAGIRDTSTTAFTVIDVTNSGLIGDGVTVNDAALSQLLQTVPTNGARLLFPAGEYRFEEKIVLPSNVVLQGEGHRETRFLMELTANDHGIVISGGPTSTIDTLNAPVQRDDNSIVVRDGSLFQAGDWVKITKNDIALVTSAWANRTVGQIVQVVSVAGNTLNLGSDMRLDYGLNEEVAIQKLNPAENVGIECISIKRIDDPSGLRANIYFGYAVNSWVNGVQSDSCNYAHVWASNSSNLAITSSYFHHAHNYGSGGKARGVALMYTTNEVLVENNVFDSLRHSVFLEAGVNCNVVAYNYSLNPYWDEPAPAPADAAGELVLEGNWAYANLFEGNIVRNIVVSNGHGANGPHNVFFRNRGEGFGIFVSDETSPNQAFVGNEVTNTTEPYTTYNLYIQGTGHFRHANNDEGVIKPAGTENLPEQSYYYSSMPSFLSTDTYASIGYPNNLGEGTIPARLRRDDAGVEYAAYCGNSFSTSVENEAAEENLISVFPNPTSGTVFISSNIELKEMTVFSITGKKVFQSGNFKGNTSVNLEKIPAGVYFIQLLDAQNVVITKKLIIRK